MKKVIAGAAIAASLAFTATAAYADGMARGGKAEPCCEPQVSWNGFYVGGGVGTGAVVHDLSVGFGGTNVLDFDGIGGQGWFGTLTIGYDHQIMPNVVVGAFFDYDFSDIHTKIAITGLLNTSLRHDNSWSVGARLGFLSSPSTLWYTSVGYTQASFDDLALGGLLGTSLQIPDFDGWFIGSGVESLLGRGWSIRGEYRWTQFDSETIFQIPGLVNVDLEPSMHTFRTVLTYRFGDLRDRVERAAPLK